MKPIILLAHSDSDYRRTLSQLLSLDYPVIETSSVSETFQEMNRLAHQNRRPFVALIDLHLRDEEYRSFAFGGIRAVDYAQRFSIPAVCLTLTPLQAQFVCAGRGPEPILEAIKKIAQAASA